MIIEIVLTEVQLLIKVKIIVVDITLVIFVFHKDSWWYTVVSI